MVSLGSSSSSVQAPTEKIERFRWSRAVGNMFDLPLLGLSNDKKFLPEAIDVGALYLDYATNTWKKPVLNKLNNKRLLKLMDKSVAASWPEGNKFWKDKRLENLQRALKHMVDVAFIIFPNMHWNPSLRKQLTILSRPSCAGCCATE